MILFLSFFCYLNYLIGNYYSRLLSLSSSWNTVFWLVHIIATIVMCATPIVYRRFPVKKPNFYYNALQWSGYIFLGIYSVLIVMMIFNFSVISAYEFFSITSAKQKEILHFNIALISLIVTGLISILGFFEIRKKPNIKEIQIFLPHLADEFDGIKILQMSDIHVGQTIRAEFVDLLVEISNKINPDIFVLTGDITDGKHAQLSDELSSFQKIKAPLGKFMVPGNHEYYWGVHEWIDYWKEIGFSPLINEHAVIEKNNAKIVMAGVHDYSAARIHPSYKSSPVDSLMNSPQDVVKILLAHQPRSIYEASKAGFDLQISGHTHSGQYFPYNFLIYFFQPYVKGLHRYKNTWIYINQGTGYWGPPSRFGVPPEITLIELKKS